MNKLSLKQGFTLVELMVVISIIAILSMIGTIVYSSVQSRARDTQRINDVRVIESALEQYYTDQNSFPLSIVGNISAGSTKYLSQVPKDPFGTNYGYQVYYNPTPGTSSSIESCTSNCNVFCLSVKLEGAIPNSTAYCPLLAGYNYQINSLNPNRNTN